MQIKDFVRGEGPEIATGYRRGDSWTQISGPHSSCSEKVFVVGLTAGWDKKGTFGEAILVRCHGCLLSWTIR